MRKKLIGSLAISAVCLSLAMAGPRSGKSSPDRSSDRVEKFNLADLADGETRTFGQGDGAITAARKGDDVTVTYGGHDGEKKTLRCAVGKDNCYAMTVDSEGKSIIVLSTGEEDADAPHMTWVTADGDEGANGVKVIRVQDHGGTVLRCPEGDATLVLKKGEENTGPYLCPKHNLQMEKSKDPVIVKEIRVEKKSKRGED